MAITLFITAPNSNDLLADLANGTAQVHSERSNGTFRRRHFLAEGTKDREIAEWAALMRRGQEADEDEGVPAVSPRSMASIAKEMLVRVSALRRVLIDLEITEALEDSDQDELEAMLVGSVEGEVQD